MFNPNMDSGVYYYSRRTGRFRYITKESAETPLTSNDITNIIQADDGLMWIGVGSFPGTLFAVSNFLGQVWENPLI